MPSNIDFTKPIYGTPTTQSVRDNFEIAQIEITDLQAITEQGPFVPLKGGIMTGYLELFADPRGNFEAATKQYVDQLAFGTSGTIPDAPKDGLFYARGGGNASGSVLNDWSADPLFNSIIIGVDSATKYFQIGYDATYNFYNFVPNGTDTFRYNRATKVLDIVFNGVVTANFSSSAITFAKPFTLAADPTVPLGAATKQYVDTKTYPYLPLAGGTITGNLGINLPVASGIPSILGRSVAPTDVTLDSFVIRPRIGNVPSSVIVLYGPLFTAPYANSISFGNDVTAKYWNFLQDGKSYFPGDLYTVGHLRPGGQLYFQTNQGISFSPTSTEPRMGFDPTGSGYFFIDVSKAAGARMAYDAVSLTWNWSTTSYDGLMTLVGPNGHWWCRGNATVGGSLTTGAEIIIQSAYGIRFSAHNSADWYAMAMNTANWALGFYYNSGFNGFFVRSFDFGGYTGFHRTAIDGNAALTGVWWGGTAEAFAYWLFSWSDRKLKWNIKKSEINAIDTVNKLNIISCDTKWIAENSEELHWDCALIADEIQDIIPGAYIKAPVTGSVGDEAPAKSYDSIREMPLIATALKAIQELSQRLVMLEAKLVTQEKLNG